MRDRLGSGQEAKSGSQRLSVPRGRATCGLPGGYVKVLPQGFHDTRRPCPGENMRFFNPLAVAFAVDTVISVNRILVRNRWHLQRQRRLAGGGVISRCLLRVSPTTQREDETAGKEDCVKRRHVGISSVD